MKSEKVFLLIAFSKSTRTWLYSNGEAPVPFDIPRIDAYKRVSGRSERKTHIIIIIIISNKTFVRGQSGIGLNAFTIILCTIIITFYFYNIYKPNRV